MRKIMLMLIAGFLLSNILYTNAYSIPESLCKEKTLDKDRFSGIVSNVSNEENMTFVTIKVNNERWSIEIPYGDMEKFKSLIGKKIVFDYSLTQYWDDHDGECVRKENIDKIIKK